MGGWAALTGYDSNHCFTKLSNVGWVEVFPHQHNPSPKWDLHANTNTIEFRGYSGG